MAKCKRNAPVSVTGKTTHGLELRVEMHHILSDEMSICMCTDAQFTCRIQIFINILRKRSGVVYCSKYKRKGKEIEGEFSSATRKDHSSSLFL